VADSGQPKVLLEAENITRRFGAFTALDGVSLRVEAGTATALLGENGAGKSTLMKVFYWLLTLDAGKLRWDGAPARFPEPAAARRAGIGMVHQHFTLVPTMSVAENLALSNPTGIRLTPKGMEASAARLSESYGLEVNPRATAGDLPVGIQRRVEILKALSASARLLILDEPTGVLAPNEVAELFEVLARLRDTGTAIILITHKLPEALALADRVAVLRRGKMVLTARREEVDADTLANAMVGRSLAPPAPLEPVVEGRVVVESPLLGVVGGGIREGETVGVAGVEGNGQAELVGTLVGLRHDAPVRLEEGGALVDASRWPVGRRIAWGLAHIPEDRHFDALALTMSTRDNLFLAGDMLPHHGPWRDLRAERAGAAAMMEEYDVRAPGMETPVGSLSGGNQQKAVVAREMSRGPRLLVAVNPTRGLDVAATEFVHDALRAHRREGGATVLVSSELDEILDLSDRILVLYNGRVVAEMRPGEADDRERLGRLMTGADVGT
jgi:simple sugar transport system ATP-binding protein